jgi:hypothetical protein
VTPAAGCVDPALGRVKIPDLLIPDPLIAAVAFRNGVPVVHYDADYDTTAPVTGQPTRWAARRGSLWPGARSRRSRPKRLPRRPQVT